MEEMCARCLIFVLNDIFIFSRCLSLGIVNSNVERFIGGCNHIILECPESGPAYARA